MITKDSIETAYSFLHQKQRIYIHSTLDWQKDDIELAFLEHYKHSFHFPGGHTPTAEEVRGWYVPLAEKMLELETDKI